MTEIGKEEFNIQLYEKYNCNSKEELNRPELGREDQKQYKRDN